jgi:hypothetical protein
MFWKRDVLQRCQENSDCGRVKEYTGTELFWDSKEFNKNIVM